jgi:hypothetical protein
VTAPAAPPLPAELDALVRRMRLPYLRKAAPDVLATARAQRWEPAEVLRVLLAEEVAGRDAAYERRSVAVTSNIHPSKAHMFAATCARWQLVVHGFGMAASRRAADWAVNSLAWWTCDRGHLPVWACMFSIWTGRC